MAKELNYYTLAEIAEQLQITRRTLYSWVKEGKLPAVKLGRQWRVSEEALADFLKKGTE